MVLRAYKKEAFAVDQRTKNNPPPNHANAIYYLLLTQYPNKYQKNQQDIDVSTIHILWLVLIFIIVRRFLEKYRWQTK